MGAKKKTGSKTATTGETSVTRALANAIKGQPVGGKARGGAKSRTVRVVVPPETSILFVELPFDVREVFGAARPPVVITVNGYSFRSTVAVYGGKYYVGVRRSHREASGVRAGQTVPITIALDDQPRVVEPPLDLAKALAKNAAARAAWEKLSFTHKREHAEAILDAKKPEARARRVEKAIEMLLARSAKAKPAGARV